MSRLIIRSRLEDIKGFMNLVPHRIEKINSAETSPIPEEYGVNALASRLHPKTVKLKISGMRSVTDKIKILTLVSSDGNKLPFFRAGQGINIKQGASFAPFSLISAPNREKYEIAVFSDNSNAVSQFLFEQTEGASVEASGPEGLFYYTSLRDRETVAAICDTDGIPSIISIAKSIEAGIDSFRLKIFYCDERESFPFKEFINTRSDFVSVEYVGDVSSAFSYAETMEKGSYSLFVSGNAEFCEKANQKAQALNLCAGQMRSHIVNPMQTAGKAEKEYICRVIYRDTEFRFVCADNETLLSAFERNGIPSAAKCKVGECGYCRCKLISGEIETISCAGIDSLRNADKKYDFVHPCRAFARSDVTLAL